MQPSVLILCTQFPPINGTAARRPYYLARQLADEGHKVTVLSTTAVEAQPWLPPLQGIAVHWAPETHVQRDTNALQRFIARLHHRTLGKPGHALLRVLADVSLPAGHIDRWDLLPEEVDARIGRHDIVLSSCPKWYQARMAAILAARWKSMFVMDYRDPWNVLLPTVSMGTLSNYGTGLAGWLRSTKMRLSERKWAGSAFALTAVTAPFLENARAATGVQRSMVVTGGFDPALRPDPSARNECFTLIYTGRLYPQQDWDAVIAALRALQLRIPDLAKVFRLEFFGAVCSDQRVLDRLAAEGARSGTILLQPRAPRDETLRAQQRADAALHVSMRDNTGWLPVKLLEYLGTGRPILLLAETHDLACDVAMRTRTGTVVRNANEFSDLLGKKIIERQHGDHWDIHPDKSQLDSFDYTNRMKAWTLKLREWYTGFNTPAKA